jgi:hypothetical protein
MEAHVKSRYTGTWYITEMEGWDTAYIDLTGPGYIAIGREGSGFMQYGAVEADLDCHIEKIGNTKRLEFSFQGFDEGDPISGRDWAVVEGTEMTGHIYIHHGDESPFKAVCDDTHFIVPRRSSDWRNRKSWIPRDTSVNRCKGLYQPAMLLARPMVNIANVRVRTSARQWKLSVIHELFNAHRETIRAGLSPQVVGQQFRDRRVFVVQ